MKLAAVAEPLVSIVIPVFNEEEVLPELHRRLTVSLQAMGRSYEVIFVDDGSRDKSLAAMKQLERQDPDHVRIFSFSRNFGHHIALTAGLDHAQGNPFQPNVVFRGFEASPLAGNALGLAVYVDGARFNQPFGDTVNWDLIPEHAIDTAVLQTSNPAFGLNALGGALAVRIKNGFIWHGAEAELAGGSQGSISGAAEYGVENGPFAAYVAFRGLHDHGWRDHHAHCARGRQAND